jgi:hypothetical protein
METPYSQTEQPRVLDRPPGFDPDAWATRAKADWLAAYPGYLSGFEEQWVAMVGPWIVAHASRFGDAADLAQSTGIERPLMVPVPPACNLIF